MIELRVGGIAALSSCDWPGELVATVFCRGCSWSCRYCHNAHLIPPRGDGDLPWSDVRAFLERRRGLLDGVVFSGGEPTVQGGLVRAMEDTRALGFRVGLHTGGPAPARLAVALPLVDWVGFDVKAPFDDYERITRVRGSGAKARESLRLLLASGVAYEVRTTVHPALLDADTLRRLAEELRGIGVSNYAVQGFRRQGCADEALRRAPASLDHGTIQAIGRDFARFSERAF